MPRGHLAFTPQTAGVLQILPLPETVGCRSWSAVRLDGLCGRGDTFAVWDSPLAAQPCYSFLQHAYTAGDSSARLDMPVFDQGDTTLRAIPC